MTMPETLVPDLAAAPLEARLIERVRAMIPALRARAAQGDAAASLHPETIADFRRADLFKILQPESAGGFALSPHTLCKAVVEAGRGDMSAAWVLFVLALHQYEVGLMSRQAQDEIWGENPNALISSSVAPFGQLERVEGGYRVTGRWRFSSGIDHAQWVGVGGLVDAVGRPGKDFRMSLLRTSEVSIDHDSWRTFALAGTGSKDFDIDGVFVPEHRTFSLIDAHEMVGQDQLPASYRYPFWVIFNAVLGSAIIGGALGGVDEAIEQMRERLGSADTGAGKQKASDDPFVRARVGQAKLVIRSAQARYAAIFAEMDGFINEGAPIPVASRMHYIAEFAQCARDCENAMLSLYKTTGGRGLAMDNPMQWILRNVLGGANHIAMNLDPMLQNLGGLLLGGEIPKVMC